MRPFYRKDRFRDEIIKVTPKELTVKIDQGDKKLSILKMEKGQSMTLSSEGHEVAIVILSGTASVVSEEFEAINKGNRKDVFSGQPTAIYIPREREYTISATGYGRLEVAICTAKTHTISEPFIVEADEIKRQVKGVFNWKREVNEILSPENSKKECGIIIGETYGCPGNWATYPYKETEDQTIFLFKLSQNPGQRVQVMGGEEGKGAYYASQDTVLAVDKPYQPIAKVEACNVYSLWFKVRA